MSYSTILTILVIEKGKEWWEGGCRLDIRCDVSKFLHYISFLRNKNVSDNFLDSFKYVILFLLNK